MKNHFIILEVVAVLAVATLDATSSEDRAGKIFICKVILSKVLRLKKILNVSIPVLR